MDARLAISKFEALMMQRKTPEQTWDLIERYIMPIRSGKFFQSQTSESSIDFRAPDIYDSTAMVGADTLSAAIHGSLTSPAIRWFDLRFRTKELNSNDAYVEWLEDTRDRIYNALYDSNFDMEIAESYLDLVGFGNSCIIEEVKDDIVWDGLDFGTIPIREVFFEDDAKGNVVNFYRWLQLTALQIYEKFGDDAPEGIKEKAQQAGQADNKIDVVYVIMKRDKVDPIPAGAIRTPDLRPFATQYIMRDGAELIGKEGGAYEMPVYITRWRKTSGSQWGYGPSNLAIPAVTTLNTYEDLVLSAAEKVIDPSIMVTERGLISDLDLTAGGVTIVRDLERSMKPFESGARFDVSAIKEEDLRQQIRAIYKLDQLEMKDSPAMTATEASIRYELMNRILGPTLGRIEKNKLTPIVERTFNIMLRAGAFADMPDGLEGADIDVEYTGPLARAQKMDNVVAYERWLTTLGGLAEMFPDMLDLPDVDNIAREIAKHLGVPATGIKSVDEVKVTRKERSDKQAAMEEATIQEQQGNAQKAVGEGEQAMNQQQE